MKKIGLIVNPVAGIGGRAGYKGSDDPENQEKAILAGYEKAAWKRAKDCMQLIKGLDGYQLYSPAGEMGAEVLEESVMEPFVCEAEAVAGGKTVALFGSYGWGDGQWMRDWVDRMSGSGATVLNGEGLICQETPDEAALAECEALGKQLASI